MHSGNVRGVPLDSMMELLRVMRLSPSRVDNRISVKQGEYESMIEVVAPAHAETEGMTISAVVTVLTRLPGPLQELVVSPAERAAINKMACLGALYERDGRPMVGSRLTVFKGEDVWKIHVPMVCAAAHWAATAPMSAVGHVLLGTQEADPPDPKSFWTEPDFGQVKTFMSRQCICTSSSLGLTAEFPLKSGAVSAVMGDQHTVLFRLRADQPHPYLGGGLLAVLEMPYQIEEPRIDRVLDQLNVAEMAPHALPPHFGAWCRGSLGSNAAYVTFLPNPLHIPGIALNLAVWAYARAPFADAFLTSVAT